MSPAPSHHLNQWKRFVNYTQLDMSNKLALFFLIQELQNRIAIAKRSMNLYELIASKVCLRRWQGVDKYTNIC